MFIVSRLSGPARMERAWFLFLCQRHINFNIFSLHTLHCNIPQPVEQTQGAPKYKSQFNVKMAWHAQPTKASQRARGRGRKMKCKTRETCAMNSVTSKHILTNESQHKRKLKLIVQRDNRHHQQPQQQQIWLFIRYIKGIKSKTIVRFTVDWFSWICPKKK